MARLEPHDVAFFSSIGELRTWLQANGQSADELWVGLQRATNERRPPFMWADLVHAADLAADPVRVVTPEPAVRGGAGGLRRNRTRVAPGAEKVYCPRGGKVY